jgi:hypothetical protein
MALSESKSGAPPKADPPKPGTGAVPTSAPGWLLWLYLGGLVLVYVGERVLSGVEKGPGFVTALGVLAVVASTLLRFSPRFRAGGERRSIETLLAVLSLGGVFALVLYGLTTPWGVANVLGGLSDTKRAAAVELLGVAWVIAIVIGTLPLIFAETALRPMRSSEHPERRRVRAAASAGLTLALAAVYGALFVYAASGIRLDVDFSYFKTSRPSESTKKLAQSLADPVSVVAFFPQVSEVRNEVMRYLDELKPGAPKLQIQVQDRLLAPKLAKEMRATQDGAIVLSRGGTTQTIVVGTELDKAKAKLKTLDRDFQEQLTKLAKARRTAYLTVGHGELNDTPRSTGGGPAARSGSIARTLLQRQNYIVKDLGLAQGLGREVPAEADVVFVLGPTEPFGSEEIESLRRYADRGGKLFLALDADAFSTRDFVTAEEGGAVPAGSAVPAPAPPAPPAVPGSAAAPVAAPEGPAPPSSGPLNALAGLVGLAYSPEVLANERMHVRLRNDDSDRTRIVTQSFSSHASVSTLSQNAARAAVVMFGAGSLEKARGSTAQADFAVRAASGTFADKNRNYKFDTGLEKQSTFNVLAAVSGAAKPDAKPAEEKKDEKDATKDKKDPKSDPNEMRAIVVADADVFGDFVLGEVTTNQILFVDSVRWLVGEQSVAGPPNTEEDKRISHTKQQDLSWFYATIFGAPGLVLASGLLISRRSRRARGAKS